MIIIELLMSISCCNAERQLSNKGTDFYVGFLPSLSSHFQPSFRLLYTSDISNSTIISTNCAKCGATITTAVNSTMAGIIPALNIAIQSISSGIPINIFAEKNKFAAVVSLVLSNGMTGSYLALPSDEILCEQYEYFALSVALDSFSSNYVAGIFLIGARNSTNISIMLLIPTDKIENDDSYSSDFTLHQKETEFINADRTFDITGTRIVSDKPLTVISGHEAGSCSTQ